MTDYLIYMGIAFAFVAIGIVVGQYRGQKKSAARILLLQGRCDTLKTENDGYKLQLDMYENIESSKKLSDAEMGDKIFNRGS